MIQGKKLRERAEESLKKAREIKRRMAEAEEYSAEDEKEASDALEQYESLMEQAGKADAFEARMAELEERYDTPPPRAGGRPSSPYAERGSQDGPHTDPKNTRNGRHQFSVMRGLQLLMAGKEVDGLEGETNKHIERKRGRPAQGMYVPTDLPFRVGDVEGLQKRDLDTSAGTGAIFNAYGSFIDILRNRLVVQQMGATVLTGMSGPFALPKQTASATAYWIAEGGAPTESGQTIGQVTLTPKTVGAYTDYTRRFMLQSSIDAEAFVRNDLMAVVARAVDLAAINGSGSSNQPLGILNYGGNVATVAIGTNGGPVTWSHLVQMETEVAADNADFGSLGYLTNSKVRGRLKTTELVSGYPQFLWNNGEPNGYRMAVSNQVPSNLTKGSSSGVCSAVIFGNWADLLIAFWSGMDVGIDRSTNVASGTVRVAVLQDVDLNIRNAESFAVIKDATTA
jgi:HK97 family phage major capsid protein